MQACCTVLSTSCRVCTAKSQRHREANDIARDRPASIRLDIAPTSVVGCARRARNPWLPSIPPELVCCPELHRGDTLTSCGRQQPAVARFTSVSSAPPASSNKTRLLRRAYIEHRLLDLSNRNCRVPLLQTVTLGHRNRRLEAQFIASTCRAALGCWQRRLLPTGQV